MATSAKREKIAILGGGMAALATAFELTRRPDWKTRYESITIYQMGWRLGGKCASSRGPNMRIEEHGIHGFLGSYHNTLPIMVECYDELGRKSGEPLASFEEAFIPQSFGLLWELRGRTLKPWAQRFPKNTRNPRDAQDKRTGFELSMVGVSEAVLTMLTGPLAPLLQNWIEAQSAKIGHHLAKKIDHPGVAFAHSLWNGIKPAAYFIAKRVDAWRRAFVVIDHLTTLLGGTFADDAHRKGFDHLDDENFTDWLKRHGAHPETIASPMNLNTINMTYQYPEGDTSRPPVMAAGAYVRWGLWSSSYKGSFIWRFSAGTGEAIIAPLYEVLRKRGVQFEFFNKVENLQLSQDGQSIAAVDIAVQAHLKDPSIPYEPLIDVNGLPSWPARPLYDQLVEGDQMRAAGEPDLESYWTPWTPPAKRSLRHGTDYDQVVLAISIGALEHICPQLVSNSPKWRAMIDHVPALTTQAMQVWLTKSTEELGWDIPLKPGEAVLSTTFLNPPNGQAELSDLIRYEGWPKDNSPKGLWYFCGLMPKDGGPADFTDHTYPKLQSDRVKYQSIQYLQAMMGLLLPGSSTNSSSPPGDPFGFNFDLLHDPSPNSKSGVDRFESQFWRANIDPTERYVSSPPGSTKHRLKAWETGYSNLKIAGDWIYNGLNVGSVEGAVMSGRLAAHGLSNFPPLEDIVGYEV